MDSSDRWLHAHDAYLERPIFLAEVRSTHRLPLHIHGAGRSGLIAQVLCFARRVVWRRSDSIPPVVWPSIPPGFFAPVRPKADTQRRNARGVSGIIKRCRMGVCVCVLFLSKATQTVG